MGKPWVKIHVEEWESGSVRVDMDSAERGFWLDMILRASHSRKEGFICRDANGEIGFTNQELAQDYHVTLELVESTIQKRLNDKSIIIHPNNVIELVNYWKYQPKISKDGNRPSESIPPKPVYDEEHRHASKKVQAFKLGQQGYLPDAQRGDEIIKTTKKYRHDPGSIQCGEKP